jgi:membrane protein
MAQNRKLQLITVAWKEFGKDRGTTVAAALSYYLLLSIFPMILLGVGAASYFVDRETVKEEVIQAFNDVVPLQSEGERDINEAVDGVIDARGAIAVFGLLGLAWAAASFFGALRTAINDAFDVTQSRPFPVQKLMDLAGVIGVGLLFVASILLTFLVQLLRATTDSIPLIGEATGLFWGLVAFFVPLLVSFTAFAIVYKFVPNTEVEWKHALIGAAPSALLFEFTKLGLSFYLSYFGNYEATYGAFGAVIAFLFWGYLTGIYLILGAEVASEYPRVHAGYHDIPEALQPPSMLDKARAKWARLSARLRGKPTEPPMEQGHPGSPS